MAKSSEPVAQPPLPEDSTIREAMDAHTTSSPDEGKRPQKQMAQLPTRPTVEEGNHPPLPNEPTTQADNADAAAGQETETQSKAQAQAQIPPTRSTAEVAAERPPLPNEPPPEPTDDGWSAEWDAARNAWYFHNRFTGLSQWDNPRVAVANKTAADDGTAAQPPLPVPVPSVSGGYNPAIHGDWDPNADYAQVLLGSSGTSLDPATLQPPDGGAGYDDDDTGVPAQGAFFNARTGKFQRAEENSERHGDEAKSHRQMNAFFDVDAAANSHDGKSLRAERQKKQPTRQELSQWKEKRKARKEEKRRAWLRD